MHRRIINIKFMCSVIYCDKCDKYIDTDFETEDEHFEEHEEEEKDEQNN